MSKRVRELMEALQRGDGAVSYQEHRVERSRTLDEDKCCIYCICELMEEGEARSDISLPASVQEVAHDLLDTLPSVIEHTSKLVNASLNPSSLIMLFPVPIQPLL